MEFVGTVTKGLLCSACTKPWDPETAKQCPDCESIHCADCQRGGTCHKCIDGKITGFAPVPKLVRQLAVNAKVCCPNKSLGCTWVGTRTDLKTHNCNKSNITSIILKRPEPAVVAYDYVEADQIPSELKCGFCKKPAVDAVQMPCEHISCKNCIPTFSSATLTCPLDRKPSTPAQISPAPKMIQSMLDELPVFCTYKKNECDWVGPRSEVKKHVQNECTKMGGGPAPTAGGGNSTNTNTDTLGDQIDLQPMTEFKTVDDQDTTQDIYALAHLQAPRLKDLTERKKPLSISVVIDVSGSMKNSGKLEMAKQSLKFMIDELTDRDELGIIAFHTDVAETIILTKMDAWGKERCRRAADSLRPLNRTNLSGGLFAGMDQVQHMPFQGAQVPTAAICGRRINTINPGGTKWERRLSDPVAKTAQPFDANRWRPDPVSARMSYRPVSVVVPTVTAPTNAPDTCRAVLLFTDGIANGGLTNEAQFKATLQKKLHHKDTKDMIVHTFGFGADHNAKMLQGLAEIASGSYYYIQDVATMKESFADCLGGLLSTVAQNIRLSIKAEPGFQVAKVLTSFKQETKDAVTTVTVKDVYSTEKRDVLVKLKLTHPRASAAPTTTPLVHFSLKYDSLLSGATETVSAQCRVLMTNRRDPKELPNKTVREQRSRIEATEVLQTARRRADMGDMSGAQQYMKQQRTSLMAMCPSSSYVSAMCDDMKEVERDMATPAAWTESGSKNMAQVLNGHGQQRHNRSSAKPALGYDNEWKSRMREKSRNN